MQLKTCLLQREIFVFGSNLAGRHGKGAALLSTLGYWNFWYNDNQSYLHNEILNERFQTLFKERFHAKDLYIIPRDNIPFEKDPLRYGDNKRETEVTYWVELCERFDVRYYVMQERTVSGRMEELEDQCRKQMHRAIGFDGYVREK